MRLLVAIIFILLPFTSLALGYNGDFSLIDRLLKESLSKDKVKADRAVEKLRSLGGDAIDRIFTNYAAEFKKIDSLQDLSSATSFQKHLMELVERVSRQKYAYQSKLYWYTDLEKAKEEARKTGNPILSLRLLGNLDDELSCANSRFFRLTLYSNSEVSAYLKQHYILHWKSVRPAPKVSIDYGDGRKIETTVTGNSIHYILSDNGEIIDAIAGLYTAADFLQIVKRGKELSDSLNRMDNLELRRATLASYYQESRKGLEDQLFADLKQVEAVALSGVKRTASLLPSAREAAPIAATKMVVERPVVDSVLVLQKESSTDIDQEVWNKIAALRIQKAGLDSSSKQLILKLNREAYKNYLSWEGAFEQSIKMLEKSIALDTVKNEYLRHSLLYDWLTMTYRGLDVESFNTRVYSEIFLTPDSDPWLGLISPESFTGAENFGIRK